MSLQYNTINAKALRELISAHFIPSCTLVFLHIPSKWCQQNKMSVEIQVCACLPILPQPDAVLVNIKYIVV